MRLWVDDERPRPDFDTWWLATNSLAAIRWLQYRSMRGIRVHEVSLDHDLSGDDTTRPVVLWMCEHDFWPEVVHVHTANPVGREWLEGMVNRYGPGVTR